MTTKAMTISNMQPAVSTIQESRSRGRCTV